LDARVQIPKAVITPSTTCRRVFAVLLGVVTLYVPVVACHFASGTPQQAALDDLRAQVRELSKLVELLQQERPVPAAVLNRYRNSIGYISGVYSVSLGKGRPEIPMRVSGSGFLAGNGLVATNRHVAQPWYGNLEAKRLIDRGATATVESLEVFFPNLTKSIKLLPGSVAKTSDLAVLRLKNPDVARGLTILPLATSPASPGQLVTVLGYPLGTLGLVVKSPLSMYERLAYRHDTDNIAHLAAMSLIRPSITYGHLGDIVGDTIVYDAPSAHGGSGGPVLNSKGEVIGVNCAYLDGFSGSTLGVSIEDLRPLIKEVQAPDR